MSTPSGVNIVRAARRRRRRATWTLTVHQHALGGIPRAAREGQVDLYAPLTLVEHPVNFARALAGSNQITGRAGAKRRRGREGVHRFEDRRLAGSVGRQENGDGLGVGLKGQLFEEPEVP